MRIVFRVLTRPYVRKTLRFRRLLELHELTSRSLVEVDHRFSMKGNHIATCAIAESTQQTRATGRHHARHPVSRGQKSTARGNRIPRNPICFVARANANRGGLNAELQGKEISDLRNIFLTDSDLTMFPRTDCNNSRCAAGYSIRSIAHQ